jgi:nucleoside-diphosphate-sugar epimerase
MTSALIFGGTRYVGKRLAAALLERGCEVTVATRGRAPLPEGARHIPLDRTDRDSLQAALAGKSWDVVYDQICYAPSDAADICEALAGRVGSCVLTSSQAVYGCGIRLPESAFDPVSYPVKPGRRADFDYAEGKRLAEAVLFQQANFPVTAVRFPVILGPDDYTQRLAVQARRVRAGEPLPLPHLDAEISLISSEEAAGLLAWLAEHPVPGPLNACSDGSLTLRGLVAVLERAAGHPATVVDRLDDDPFSLFAVEKSLTLDTARASRAGFTFEPVLGWLQELANLTNSAGW